jgi:hypothetical protein
MGSLQTQTSIDGGREARHEKAGLFISVDSSLAPPSSSASDSRLSTAR